MAYPIVGLPVKKSLKLQTSYYDIGQSLMYLADWLDTP